METKSLLPAISHQQQSYVMSSIEACEPMPYQLNESLSDSLIERFDNMETEENQPERQIVSVVLLKDNYGRLGLKITGTPHGIYVEDFESAKVKIEGASVLKRGDRIVAINGRSLENVSYANALELVKKSGASVQFLVSQIKS
jgi:C-terminal processing protease CtpA/Prc